MIFLGIDPGMSGGMAIIYPSPPSVIKFSDKTEADISNLFGMIAFDMEEDKAFAMIENVHSMPKQGVSSSFKFGRNFGLLLGCLYSYKIPFELVSPQKWQKEMGCLTHGDKNISKTKAQQLFPQIKVTHAIADALLLAEYCRRVNLQR